jgi:predicted dehydrogenase
MRITGSEGEAFAHNFCVAALDDRITVNVAGQHRVEELGKKTTYTYQLEAFADYIRSDAVIYTDAEDAVTQAELIDACYQAAGFPLRPVSTI